MPNAASGVNCTAESCAAVGRASARNRVPEVVAAQAFPDVLHRVVWRFQHEQADVYVGRYLHVLVRSTSGLMFRERRAVLDLETLRPHGKLSFIL
jgi:hypothetical protein